MPPVLPCSTLHVEHATRLAGREQSRGPLALLLSVALLFACGTPHRLHAGDPDAWPDRPIKLVVPFAPGGSSDTLARIIKRAIEENELLPQPVVIINRGGAGGTIGSRSVKNAEADGLTLLLLHDAIFTAQLVGNADYGPEAFEPVAATGASGTVIAVGASSDVKDLSDLLTRIENEPGKITFAANLGAPSHFAALMLEEATDEGRFRFTQSGGGTRRFEHLQGGHVDATTFSLDEYQQFRSEGVRALAYLGEERHPDFPDLPTAIEQGVSVTHRITQYWWVPEGTPSDRVQRLARALEAAMETEYVRDRLRQMNVDPLFLTGEPLRDYLGETGTALSKIDPRETLPLPNLPLLMLIASGVLGAAYVAVSVWSDSEGQPASDVLHLPQRWGLLVGCLTLTACYAAALIGGWVGIGIGTGLFVLTTGGLLAWGERKRLASVAVLALLSGVVFHVVFVHLFVIDL